MSFKIDINVEGIIKSERVITRTFDSLKKGTKETNSALGVIEKNLKVVTQAQAIYNRSVTSNELKRGKTALKKITKEEKLVADEILRAEESQKKYNRSVVANELKRGKTALKKITKEEKSVAKEAIKAEKTQRKYNRSVVANELKRGKTALRGIRKEQEALNKSSKNLMGTSLKRIAAGNLLAMGLAKGVELLSRQVLELKNYSDEWIKVTNIIRLGVKSEGELVAVRQRVLDISQETRTDMVAQTTLFNRLTLSQKELGASSEDILGVIRGVGHALGVTATSALESRGSLIQLSQAFGQPIVRAEEFNSILEGTPRIASALADGFGLTRSALRKLVLEGKVTNKQFFEALRSQLPLLEQEFRNVAPTIDQGMTVIKNGMRAVVGQFNELTGAAPAIAAAFIQIGNAMSKAAEFIGKMAELTGGDPITEQIKVLEKRLKMIIDSEQKNYNSRINNAQKFGDDLKRIQSQWVVGFLPQPTKEVKKSTGLRDAAKDYIAAGLIPEAKDLKSMEEKKNEVIKALSLLRFDQAKADRDKNSRDYLSYLEEQEKALIISGKKQLEIIKNNFKSYGIITKEGRQLLINEIYKERDDEIKISNDKVTANAVAAAKIEKINAKVFQENQKRLKERQKYNRDLYSDEIIRAGNIKDLNLDRIKSIEKNQKDVDKEIADSFLKQYKEEERLLKKQDSDELRRILVKARAMKDLNLLRLEELKHVEVSPIGPQTDFEKYIEGINESIDATQVLHDMTIKAFKGMEDALVTFITTGEFGFKEFANTAIAELTRIFVRSQIIAPLASTFGSMDLLGSLGNLLPFAQGGVVSGSNISQFSSSVLTGPTTFPDTKITPYAKGTALAGEDGYEGILPLTRIGGELGVNAEGMASKPPIINISVENNVADKAEANVTSSKDDLGNTVIGIVIDAAQRNVGGFGNIIQGVARRK